MSGDQQQGHGSPEDATGQPEVSAERETTPRPQPVARGRVPGARIRIPDIGRDLRRVAEQATQVHRLVERALEFRKPFEQLNELIDSVTRWQQPITVPILNYTKTLQFSRVDLPLQRMADQVAEIFSRLPSIDDIQRRILIDEGPDNWADLRDTHDILKLLEIAEEGIPVAWVPRATVLAELIDAEPDQHHHILLSHQADVLDDCDNLLAEVDDGLGTEQARLLQQATQALRRGHFAPSQALAANIVDTVLRTAVLAPTGRYYPKVKAKIDEAPLYMLPWAVTHWPVLTVLQDFHGGSDEPTPGYFNRHASAHQADLSQYTPVNALVSVMLASSVLTEARHFQDKLTTADDTADDTEESERLG